MSTIAACFDRCDNAIVLCKSNHGQPKMKKLLLIAFVVAALSACTDEVGSVKWCKRHKKKKPKSEWTTDNAVNFAQYCVFQNEIGSKKWCKA